MSFAWAQVWEQLFVARPVNDPPRWDWWNHWDVSNWAVLFLPLYAVFAAVAIPTMLVWRFGPKPVKPGHCRCGYDLRGNESGVCPECGVEVRR